MDPSRPSTVDRADLDRDRIEEDFRLIYERQRADVLRFAASWTRDSVAAEDVCQEAFTRLYRVMSAGREPEVVGAWLRSVARNLVISRARRAEVESRHAAQLHEVGGHDPTARTVLE